MATWEVFGRYDQLVRKREGTNLFVEVEHAAFAAVRVRGRQRSLGVRL